MRHTFSFPWRRTPSTLVHIALTIGVASMSLVSCGDDGEFTTVGGGGADGGTDSSIGGNRDGSIDVLMPDRTGDVGEQCTGGCPENMVCSHGQCVLSTTCETDNDCSNDTYCVKGTGCVPWGTPSSKTNDPNCVYVAPPGILAPKARCEFSAPPTNDPFPNHRDVQATPTVVNLNKPASAGPPSIIVPFTDSTVQPYTETQGVIRVIRGDNCQQQAVFGGTDLDSDGAIDWIRSPSTLALGDLDDDGVADVVAYGADGSTLAFTLKDGTWSLLWKGRQANGSVVLIADATWAGPSMHDLDDDGKPEVIREGYVFSNEGVLLSGLPTGYASYSVGMNAVLANIDSDEYIELLNGANVWQWRQGAWEADTQYAGPAAGHVAVADFGPYGDASSAPEIAIVQSNTLTIVDSHGAVLFGPIALPGGGTSAGGPPTIADYDGDGLPEVGVAGSDFYTVFDIDCGPNPRSTGACATQNRCDNTQGVPGACPAGVLWSRKTQDHSSNITGSSVFDFEADGIAEVVYADECFARVYNGQNGEVVFSQYHSSCTWYENPVVADADGNFRADLIVPSNIACQAQVACVYNAGDPVNSSLDENQTDKEFAGLRCKTASDCVSHQCVEGLCRCTSSAQCCAQANDDDCIEFGYRCAPPPTGTAGTGNTCRASFPHKFSGIRVYSDAADKWVRSRTIWNQHAYAVTHVNEDGTVPRSSEWKKNWEQPELNNFRQNVPGTPNGQMTADPTAGASDTYQCGTNQVTLSVPICNRGADDVAPGLVVGFYVDNDQVCQTQTTTPLAPGDCQTVSCVWSNPPSASNQAKDVTVVVNDGGAVTECKDGNDKGTIFNVYCEIPH